MYKLEIKYLEDGSVLQDWYGDSVLFLPSDYSVDEFMRMMVRVTDGVDLTQYVGENKILDIKFYKDVINVFSDDHELTDDECLADLMDIAKNDKEEIFEGIYEYEDLINGEMVNKILENSRYNLDTVGYSHWCFAFYEDGFAEAAERLYEGLGFYDVSLLDENHTVIESSMVDYENLSKDDIDEILWNLGFDGTYDDIELIGDYEIISDL